jgi:hypothetical protein
MRKLFIAILSISFLLASTPMPAQAAFVPKGEQVEVFFQWAKNGGFLGIAKNASGKEMFRIASDPTSKEVLRQFGPRVLSETIKKAAVGTGNIMIKKMARFPVESLGFFIALGGVMTYDLIFKSAQNPTGYKQLIDSQMDPLGQFAFYSFMVANGLVSEPMMAMVQKGKWNGSLRHFIPYLGMSVGMTASHLVHELGTAEDLHKCVGDFLTANPQATESCEAAHEAWIERGGLGGLTHDLAPSLIGLIGSTIISGGAQKFGISVARVAGLSVIVKTVAEITLGSILKVVGVEIATAFVPGGLIIKFMRGAFAFVVQMAFFTWVQEQIQPGINFAFANMFDGRDVDTKVYELSKAIQTERSFGWSPPLIYEQGKEKEKKKLVLNRLSEFGKKMSQWRQSNMEQVLVVQANWEQATGQLAQQYRVTRDFYSDLTGNLWQKNNGRYKDLYASGEEIHLLDRPAPLDGIPTMTPTEDDPMIYSQAPDRIEAGQVAYVHHVVEKYQAKIPRIDKMDDKNQKWWDYALKNLLVDDPIAIGAEIDRIRCLMGYPGLSYPRRVKYIENCNYSISFSLNDNFRRLLLALTNQNGLAQPQWGSGKTYINAYEMENDLSQVWFDEPVRTQHYNTPLNKLLAYAMTGPIPGKDKMIIEDAGYPAKFHPPRLSSYDIRLLPQKTGLNRNDFMQMQANVAGIGPNRGCGMAYDCLFKTMHSGAYDPANYAAFDNWWESKVEPDYIKAWLKFEQKYQYNIGKLVEALWQGKSPFNRGNLANGIVESYLEEARIYLSTLSTIARDQVLREQGRIPPLMMRDAHKTTKIGNIEFGGKQFHWQIKFMEDMEKMAYSLKKIKVQKIPVYTGKKEDLPVSTLTTSELEEYSQLLTQRTAEIALFLKSSVKLNNYQNAVAAVCLQGLSNLNEELKTIGLVVNSASYRERHDIPGGFASPRCESLIAGNHKMGGTASLEAVVAGCRK